MESIFENLTDASWWFTAFFVAIVSSVIAGFLKGRIERFFSRSSKWYRYRRATAIEQRTAVIKSLADNPIYLTIAFHLASLRLLVWMMAAALFFLTPISLAVVPESYDALLWFNQKHLAKPIMLPLLGILGIWSGFSATSSLSLAFEGFRQYRAKNNLPDMP